MRLAAQDKLRLWLVTAVLLVLLTYLEGANSVMFTTRVVQMTLHMMFTLILHMMFTLICNVNSTLKWFLKHSG